MHQMPSTHFPLASVWSACVSPSSDRECTVMPPSPASSDYIAPLSTRLGGDTHLRRSVNCKWRSGKKGAESVPLPYSCSIHRPKKSRLKISAPCFIKYNVISMWPNLHASMTGVNPLVSWMLTSAPCSTNNFTIFMCPIYAMSAINQCNEDGSKDKGGHTTRTCNCQCSITPATFTLGFIAYVAPMLYQYSWCVIATLLASNNQCRVITFICNTYMNNNQTKCAGVRGIMYASNLCYQHPCCALVMHQ